MSLELVVTEKGKIKCTGGTYILKTPNENFDPTKTTHDDNEYDTSTVEGTFDFGTSQIASSMSFTGTAGSIATVATVYKKSSYTSIDDSAVILDSISMSGGPVTFTSGAFTGALPSVTIDNKLTSYSTCINDLGTKILLKPAYGSVSVTLTNAVGATMTMNLTFTISDAGQSSTTAD